MGAQERRASAYPAEILGSRLVNGKPLLTLAAFRTRPSLREAAKGFHGRLTLICPFCGKQHVHGACGPKFGDGDGHRSALCTEVGYEIQEVREARRAGSLPRGERTPAFFLDETPADSGTDGEAA